MTYVGIVYDYDAVEPLVVFGPFATPDQALAEGQVYIQQRVMSGDWDPVVLSEDYEDIQVIVEPLFFNTQHHANWVENNKPSDDDEGHIRDYPITD